jgi:hypothetical protein
MVRDLGIRDITKIGNFAQLPIQQLAPCSVVFLQNLAVHQLSQIPRILWNLKVNYVLTRARHCSLSCAKLIQSTPSHPVSPRHFTSEQKNKENKINSRLRELKSDKQESLCGSICEQNTHYKLIALRIVVKRKYNLRRFYLYEYSDKVHN